jgi:hypothetical protein
MYMAIAVFFILAITAILSFGAHYECEHFDKNHGIRRRKRHK